MKFNLQVTVIIKELRLFHLGSEELLRSFKAACLEEGDHIHCFHQSLAPSSLSYVTPDRQTVLKRCYCDDFDKGKRYLGWFRKKDMGALTSLQAAAFALRAE
ncbi:unnamed protein product [Prunus armeniaca]|uniref:Uncharacterized protein n=1 Tax=Prunus armeniaca TaxID=36596 RepID=A0A6J5TFP6_PRUAR|nr:unnamed protein product [Prunus armeniaca]